MSLQANPLRALTFSIASALIALAFWACDGGGAGLPPVGEEITPTPLAVEPSCAALKDIQSYRYFIDLKLQSPAFQRAQETPHPLSDFAEALASLFSDMELEGSFVAPDRSQTLLRFQGEELEVRIIGDQSWVRVGATWQEQPVPGENDILLSPGSVCEELVEDLAPSLAAASGELDVVSGLETVHYQLDEAALKGLPELLGPSGQEGLPQEFGVDIWLERNEGWPVRLEIAASDTDEEGNPVSLELSMAFSDINDPNIDIEPPPVSPAQT